MEGKSEGKSVEIRAKTVDAAIEKGLAELGISREEAEIVVVKEGSRGVLGIGAEDAIVRVSVRPQPSLASPAGKPAAESKTKQPASVQALKATEAEREKVAEIAKRVLQDLLDRMGIPARVELVESAPSGSEASEDSIILNVTGNNLGVLIGRRGETLADLQFIVRLMVSRQIQRWPSIIVDVEYYKARREKMLTDLAERMAEKVRSTRQPIALEPMSARERRIVHLALRNSPDVFTESTGEGEKRKVVILPKS